jgi:hypothetical protein
MVTSRLGSDRGDNVAYGLDAVIRPFGDEWVTARWAQTFDSSVSDASAIEVALLQLHWERIRDEGFSYSGEFRRVGRDYLPGLGFQDRRDFRFLGADVQFKRFQGPHSPFRSRAVRLIAQEFVRSSDGTPESRRISPEGTLEFKGGTEIRLTGNSRFESIRLPFAVAGVDVPEGEYWFHQAEARLQLARSGLFRGVFTATAGSFYDGTRFGLALNPAWTHSRYLELGGGYEVNRLEFEERGLATTTHLAQLRVQVALNTRVSLSTLAQYSNVADLAAVNARFRYHFREGTDLWIVYNQGLNTDRDSLEPLRGPLTSGRSLMVKYSHTVTW